jgi:branched-subunit amino acid aminotransferase/4-amino-4-deoxychorismate lyase
LAFRGRVYCLDARLGRLKASAEGLQLPLPPELAEAREIIRQAYGLGWAEDLLIRLNVSRWPGSFTVNPYDSGRSQLCLTTAVLKTPPPEDFETGASAFSSPFGDQGHGLGAGLGFSP